MQRVMIMKPSQANAIASMADCPRMLQELLATRIRYRYFRSPCRHLGPGSSFSTWLSYPLTSHHGPTRRLPDGQHGLSCKVIWTFRASSESHYIAQSRKKRSVPRTVVHLHRQPLQRKDGSLDQTRNSVLRPAVLET